MQGALILSVVALVAVSATAVWLRSRHLAAAGLIPVPPGCLKGWNVLLVSGDTTRADRLGCYGCPLASTQTMDALAASGVRFQHAVAPAPFTLPSHASLLTGLDPYHHGARTNGIFRVDDKVVTLAERLRSGGYRTGAVVSAYVLDRQYNLSQGFDDYDDDLARGEQAGTFGFRERRAELANEAAIRWLRRPKDRPFFLWLHYFDPHAPYRPPEPYRTTIADRPYDGEIAYVDDQFGRLLKVLDEIGARGRTLVVVVGDHGESLGEHGELTHGIMIYDATQRVPMIWNAPGILPAGAVVQSQVGLVDVASTILDLLGESLPANADGISLLRPESARSRELYIESLGPKFQYGWSPLVGLRADDAKFILAPRPEFYDLRADPNELANLFDDRRRTAEQYHERLKTKVGGDLNLSMAVLGNLPLDAASRAKLESLGYVFAGTTTTATSRQALPDPKDMMGDWALLQKAESLADGGRHAEAVALLEPLVRRRPNNLRAWEVLSESYQALGRLDQALASYRQEAAIAHRKVEANVGIGSILLEMGKVSEAEEAFTRALTEDPQSHRAVFGMAALRARQNRSDEALRLFRQSAELGRGVNTSMALFNIGAIHYAAGRASEARRAMEEALAIDPANVRAARSLAEILRQAGRRKPAIEVLRRAIDLRPDAEALVALGQMLAEDGQLRPAREALNRSLDLNPSLPQAHLHLGIILAGERNFAEAETHLRRSTELAPGWAEGHYNLGVLLAMQDKLPPAVAEFTRTIELQPHHAAARNALGQALMSLNRNSEAAEQFRQALEIDPNFAVARENLHRCTTSPTTTSSRPSAP